MTTQILCLGAEKSREAADNAVKALSNLAEKLKIELKDTFKTESLKSLIMEMVPALENNNIIFILADKSEYTRAKNMILQAMGVRIVAHPSILRAIAVNAKESVLGEKAEEHAAMPKGGTLFLSTNGYYSGFALEEGGQHIIMIPLGCDSTHLQIENGVKGYVSGILSKNRVTKVIGMFGVSKTEAETTINEILDDDVPIEYEIKDFGGELQVILTVSTNGEDNAKRKCDLKIDEIVAKYKKNVYGINQPRLAELTVHSLKASGFDVAVVVNPGAQTLLSKLEAAPEYSAFFKFVEAGLEQNGQPANDYAARLANAARITSASDFGAAITNMYTTSSDGEKMSVMYIALADGKHVWVRKVFSKSTDNAGEILHSASTCLLELIYKKSEEYLNSLLVSPPDKDSDKEIHIEFEESDIQQSDVDKASDNKREAVFETKVEEKTEITEADANEPEIQYVQPVGMSDEYVPLYNSETQTYGEPDYVPLYGNGYTAAQNQYDDNFYNYSQYYNGNMMYGGYDAYGNQIPYQQSYQNYEYQVQNPYMTQYQYSDMENSYYMQDNTPQQYGEPIDQYGPEQNYENPEYSDSPQMDAYSTKQQSENRTSDENFYNPEATVEPEHELRSQIREEPVVRDAEKNANTEKEDIPPYKTPSHLSNRTQRRRRSPVAGEGLYGYRGKIPPEKKREEYVSVDERQQIRNDRDYDNAQNDEYDIYRGNNGRRR